MQYITLLDYIILPFVLIPIYLFAYSFRNKHYKKSHPYRKYFIPALTVKIVGAILIGLIYAYYYKGGDTFNYFQHARIINSSFADSIVKWFNLILRIPTETTIGYYQYITQMGWYSDPSSYTVASLVAFISFFVGTTYLPTAVIFALISFTGAWALFRSFVAFYPTLIKPVAIAIFFIPSVIIWGSGIFKDTLCMFALGWLTYGTFQMLVKRKLNMKNILFTLLSFFLIYRIKVYILIAFVPALLIWILFTYTQAIKDNLLRIFTKAIIFFTFTILSTIVFVNLGENELGRYSFTNIEKTTNETRNWISYSSGDEGSAYDLGEIGSGSGLFLKFPAAVNVTLFRPYLWESKKLIVLFSAVEAFLFLFLTIKIIVILGFRKIWHTISTDPNIQFCLIFTLVFAFAVGISTYNFGALSRYKIPCLPFYAMALVLIYYKNKPMSKKLFKPFGL